MCFSCLYSDCRICPSSCTCIASCSQLVACFCWLWNYIWYSRTNDIFSATGFEGKLILCAELINNNQVIRSELAGCFVLFLGMAGSMLLLALLLLSMVFLNDYSASWWFLYFNWFLLVLYMVFILVSLHLCSMWFCFIWLGSNHDTVAT